MSQKTSEFTQVINDVGAMSENQRQIVADGCEDDEHYRISINDYASDDDFERAVVAEIMKLLNLG